VNTEALTAAPSNPWKGLHFYTEADRNLFFGRDRETEEFLRLVRRDTLSILFARSGLGKTSFLRAAVIPRLRVEDLLPVIVRIDYAVTAPTPTLQIIEASLASARQADIDVDCEAGTDTESFITTGNPTLWEFFHHFRFWGPRNDPVLPILILDQFEELFTLGRHGPHTEQFLTQLADLVENRMPETVQQRIETSGERPAFDTRVRCCKIILSLREDFVPRLDSLRQVMPAVMRNRFVLPPLDQERAIDIVLRAGERWVSDGVAAEIAAVVAGESLTRGSFIEIEPAYLSVMCHELFRRMLELGRDEIGLDLVSAEHGDILDGLYERSFEGIEPKTRIFVEDRLLTDTGYRGSVPVAEAEREGIHRSELESLVDRRLLRFEDRLGTTHVELSHDLLTAIVQKSRDHRRAEAEREAERQREAYLQAKVCRERRRTFAWAGLALLLLAGIGLYIYGWWIPYRTYCRDITKRWGVPWCVGPLPEEAVAHRAWTIRLTRRGRFGQIHTMEVIDPNHQLTAKAEFENYLDRFNASSHRIEKKEARHEYIYDHMERVIYEIARNRYKKMLWGFAYAPDVVATDCIDKQSLSKILWEFVLRPFVASQLPNTRKGTYLGPDGYPLPQSQSKAEYVELHYDEQGFENELRFTDRQGNPTPASNGAYGQRKVYDSEGREVRRTYIDRANKPFHIKDGYAGWRSRYDDRGNEIEVAFFDEAGKPIRIKDGYAGWRSRYDDRGNEIEVAYFDESGKPIRIKDGYAGWHSRYDDRGNEIERTYFDETGKSLGADAFYMVYRVQSLVSILQPAVKAGIQAGDIFWKYGTWSFPKAWEAERVGKSNLNKIYNAVWKEFLAERNRLSDRPVTMTVIRHGRPVELIVPVLPKKMLGARIVPRIVPITTFEAWKAAANHQN